MIYTVTLNPSIDYYVTLDNLRVGEKNITRKESTALGGKGLNVSNVLSTFSIQNKAFTFLAGSVGKMCEKMLHDSPFKSEIIWLKEGNTRINIKLKVRTRETEINGQGPDIDNESFNVLLSKLRLLKKGDVLILSGSAPKSLGDSAYKQMVRAVDPNVIVIVDTVGKNLLNCLNHRPFLIKPNYKELEEIYGQKITDQATLLKAMRYLRSIGARNVLVSLGDKGAVLMNEYSKIYYASAKPDRVINTVGSGDCMIAAFIATYLKIDNYKKALAVAVAAGSANAYSQGLPTYNKIKDVLLTTTINEVPF